MKEVGLNADRKWSVRIKGRRTAWFQLRTPIAFRRAGAELMHLMYVWFCVWPLAAYIHTKGSCNKQGMITAEIQVLRRGGNE